MTYICIINRLLLMQTFIFDFGRSAILFLVEDVTYNICDQRFHEFEIQKQNPTARVIRKSLTQVGKTGHLDSSKRLIM